MGGTGSGPRWRPGSKATTEDYLSIDIRSWKRQGLIVPHRDFVCCWVRGAEPIASVGVRVQLDRVIVMYTYQQETGSQAGARYAIELEWTHCPLGGQRPWFLCPAVRCERRVAILYAGAIFACRQCHQLNYRSTRESREDAAIRRAETIREKLGWESGILYGKGPKPKGMRWHTFHRLCAEYDALVEKALANSADGLEMLLHALEETE